MFADVSWPQIFLFPGLDGGPHDPCATPVVGVREYGHGDFVPAIVDVEVEESLAPEEKHVGPVCGPDPGDQLGQHACEL